MLTLDIDPERCARQHVTRQADSESVGDLADRDRTRADLDG